jgi:hypothetical protein
MNRGIIFFILCSKQILNVMQRKSIAIDRARESLSDAQACCRHQNSEKRSGEVTTEVLCKLSKSTASIRKR